MTSQEALTRAALALLSRTIGSPARAYRWGEIPASETLNMPAFVEGHGVCRIGDFKPATQTVDLLDWTVSGYPWIDEVPVETVWLLRRVR